MTAIGIEERASARPSSYYRDRYATHRDTESRRVGTYEGPATIEAYTVLYERNGSARRGVIVARTPDGARTLATVPEDDAGGITLLTDGTAQPVGAGGTIAADGRGDQIWRRAA